MGEWTDEKIKKRLDELKVDVETNGRAMRGRKEIISFCENKRLSAKQSIIAHCYQCMGYFDNPGEGRDCENPVCPLYPHMPYSSKKHISRVITEKQKAKQIETLRKSRRKKND